MRQQKNIHLVVPHRYERDANGLYIYYNSDDEVVENWNEPGLDIWAPDYEEREQRKSEEGIHRRLLPNEPSYTSETDESDLMVPIRQSFDNLLREYFKIDEKKLEEERRAMLDALRA